MTAAARRRRLVQHLFYLAVTAALIFIFGVVGAIELAGERAGETTIEGISQ